MNISKAGIGAIALAAAIAGAGGAYYSAKPAPRPSDLAAEGTAAPAAADVLGPEPHAPAAAPAPIDRLEQPAVESQTVQARAPRAAARPDPQPASAPATVAPAPQDVPTEERPVQPDWRDDRVTAPAETPRAPETAIAAPPAPRYEDLVVPALSVIGLQIESTVTSERARVEDEVTARVTRDVRVGDRVAIPAGSKAIGFVTMVERGGRVRDRARLGVRFTSIVLSDGSRLPLATETIYREGDSSTRESASKIGGGAIGGAIIGGILGGAKGAAIGSAIGAGGGTAAVMAGGRNAATLASGSPVTVRVEEPVYVTVER
jgi:hypothetical protein